MKSRWLWLAFLALLAWAVWEVGSDGSWLVASGFGVVVLAFGWWGYPRRGAGTRRAEGSTSEGAPDDESVVIYWRPGCVYCSALRRRLGRTGRAATWVNIWTDEAAAAYVRSVNNGNETVPTVVIDGEAHTNPPANVVREALPAQT